MSNRVEQIRAAHIAARPNAAVNPAWANAERDIGVLLAEMTRLRTALEFYRDGFEFHTNPRRAGLEWKPKETLLDDCGNIARIALTEGGAQ